MKYFLLIAALSVTIPLLSGCNEAAYELSKKHQESNDTGLWRKITFFPPNGEPKVWKGRYKVESDGATIRFLHEGKVITIGGSFLAEEIDPPGEIK